MKDDRIFSVCDDDEFFGRAGEIEYICRRAEAPRASSPGIYLAGPRWMGKTEILRRVYHRLFGAEGGVVPFYYQFKGYLGADDFADDYVREVFKQYLAFSLRDPGIASGDITLAALARLLSDRDMPEAAGFVSRHLKGAANGDRIAVLRGAINAPSFIAELSGTQVFLVLDDLDLAEAIPLYKAAGVMKEYMAVLTSGEFSFAASGTAKRVLGGGGSRCSIEAVELQGLEEDCAVMMMREGCRLGNLDYDTEILTQAARLLGGNPMYIKNIIWAAGRTGAGFLNLRDLAEVYTHEVTEGNIAFSLRSALSSTRGFNALRVLELSSGSTGGVSYEDLSEELALGPDEIKRVVEGLGESAMVEISSGVVKWAGDNAARDFTSYVHATEVRGTTAEEARTRIVMKRLKEGFHLQGATLQGSPAEELRAILRGFKGQKVSRKTLGLAGPGPKKTGKESKSKGGGVVLPHIVGCFDAVAPGGEGRGETGPAVVVAQGFKDARYDEGNEVTWIAGTTGSPEKVNKGDVENFIRRSRSLGRKFKGTELVRWMVGWEGFTDGALAELSREDVRSTDGVGFRILRDAVEDSSGTRGVGFVGEPIKEFEIMLPNRARAELVAAGAAEEIAEETGFDEDTVMQIKTAVVEACINAFEHGRVKEGKVQVRFVAGTDRLAVHVRNTGGVFDGTPATGGAARAAAAKPHTRGWGITLMRRLMDEVRFNKLSGGTGLVMVKYLKKDGEDGV